MLRRTAPSKELELRGGVRGLIICFLQMIQCSYVMQFSLADSRRLTNWSLLLLSRAKHLMQWEKTSEFYIRISKEGGLGKYLRLPEHFGRHKKDLFTSIVEKIRQRSASWSTRFLSKAGKLTMLDSVLSAIPTYTMSCFQLPMSLCKRIQSVLTRFWWDGPNEKKKNVGLLGEANKTQSRGRFGTQRHTNFQPSSPR